LSSFIKSTLSSLLPRTRCLPAGLVAALDEDGTGAASVAAAVRDANKRTALHFAAREGRTDVCEFLIGELGLPVDPKDEDGWYLPEYQSNTTFLFSFALIFISTVYTALYPVQYMNNTHTTCNPVCLV
jgi:hypothetical protein